jgi:hypothetical protein
MFKTFDSVLIRNNLTKKGCFVRVCIDEWRKKIELLTKTLLKYVSWIITLWVCRRCFSAKLSISRQMMRKLLDNFIPLSYVRHFGRQKSFINWVKFLKYCKIDIQQVVTHINRFKNFSNSTFSLDFTSRLFLESKMQKKRKISPSEHKFSKTWKFMPFICIPIVHSLYSV